MSSLFLSLEAEGYRKYWFGQFSTIPTSRTFARFFWARGMLTDFTQSLDFDHWPTQKPGWRFGIQIAIHVLPNTKIFGSGVVLSYYQPIYSK
jgi:hypothetical protein